MNLMGTSWTALMDMPPQRSHQMAWFVYGWQGIGNTVRQIEPQVSIHESDRAERCQHGSPRLVELLS